MPNRNWFQQLLVDIKTFLLNLFFSNSRKIVLLEEIIKNQQELINFTLENEERRIVFYTIEILQSLLVDKFTENKLLMKYAKEDSQVFSMLLAIQTEINKTKRVI